MGGTMATIKDWDDFCRVRNRVIVFSKKKDIVYSTTGDEYAVKRWDK
jgi:hypothetical protein